MTVNLKDELLSVKRKSGDQADVLSAVAALLAENESQRQAIRDTISKNDTDQTNSVKFELLATDRIYHIGHIKKLCIAYRLRFLDSNFFRNGIPEEAISQVREIEKTHNTKLGGFKIVAPTKAFHLLNYNDPMLFAPLGNDYYYLVHQWGTDMNAWRKWLVLPFRNIGNFTLLCLIISILVTLLFPLNKLGEKIPMASVIVFLFAFKSIFFVAMYGFFMKGRKFSAQMWDSKFYNN